LAAGALNPKTKIMKTNRNLIQIWVLGAAMLVLVY
jgi:hypothetical protein